MSEKKLNKCPSCQKEIEYYELECDEPFKAPFELRFKAITVWGIYDAPKAIVCQKDNFVHFKFLWDGGKGSERLVKMLGFDREKFYEEQEKLRNEKHPCQHTDENDKAVCQEEGNAIFSIFQPDEPIGYYCDEHCFENGACRGCYQFLAGLESFDFSQSGFCGGCDEEIARDFSDYDGDDDEYNYDDDDDDDFDSVY